PQRFRREFRAMARLSHPNIVKVFDLVHEDQTCFLVMELVPGETFRAWRRQMGGRIPPDRLQPIVRQVLEALAAIHGEGLVHRDITPTNIMVADERVKLMDFGLVKPVHPDVSLTVPGTILGTMNYISPEQARGEQVDFRSDLYSLGVVLFEALSGNVPFQGADPIALIIKHVTEAPPPLEGLVTGLPDAWRRFVETLMRKTPADRFQSCEEALRFLNTIDGRATPPTVAAKSRADFVYRAPMVGRERELAELESAFKELNGGGTVVWLSGEAGAGKSRLVQEFCSRLEASGVRWQGSACHEYEDIPYQLIADLLANLQTLQLDPQAIQTAVNPDSSSQEHVRKFYEDIASPEKKYGMFARTLDLITGGHIQVLVLDNLQWLDNDTLQFLSFVVRHLDTLPLLVIGIYRPDEVTSGDPVRRLQGVARRVVRHHAMELKRLDEETSRAMIAAMLGDARTAEVIGEDIFNESEGNPLFIQELLRMWVEEGRLQREYGRWRYRTLELDTIPVTIKELVQRRRSRLSQVGSNLLDLIAVHGRVADYNLLEKAAALDEDDLLDGIEELVRAGLLVELARPGGEEYELSHQQIGRVACDELPATRLRRLHRRLADAMVSLGGDRDVAAYPLLAEHFFKSGEWERAYEFNRLAGKHAAASLSWDQAGRFQKNALTALEHLGNEPVERSKVLVDLIGSLSQTGRANEVLALMPETLELLTSLRRYSSVPVFVLFLATTYIVSARWDDMAVFLDRVEEINQERQDRELDAFVLLGRGFWARNTGRLDEALDAFERSIGIFTMLNLQSALVGTMQREIGNIHSIKGDYETALTYHAAGLAWRKKHGQVIDVFDYNDLSQTYHSMGDLDSAMEAIDKALERIKIDGTVWMHSIVLGNKAYLYMAKSQWLEASRWFEKARRESEKYEGRSFLRFYGVNYYGLLYFSGRLDEAMGVIALCLEASGIAVREKNTALGFMTMIYLQHGDIASAEGCITELREPEGDSSGTSWAKVLHGAILLARGQTEAAIELNRRLEIKEGEEFFLYCHSLWFKCVAAAHAGDLQEVHYWFDALRAIKWPVAVGWQWLTAIEVGLVMGDRAADLLQIGYDLVEAHTGQAGLSYWLSRPCFHRE
ncbi:protein kinase, partial [bacterium]|nr:protein kinase [candidate division CSSED10-310 bacterium]